MIPVEQRGRLDCMTACLASIFEVPYKEAPVLIDQVTGDTVERWRGVYDGWLARRGWAVLERVRTAFDDEDEMACPWRFPGFWIASVRSPREEGLTHGLVMNLSEVVWDPHPLRAQGHRGFVGAEYFLPLDPARFRLT